MRRIYKYELEVTDRQDISMHKHAELLSVGIQKDTVYLWAMVYTDEKLIERQIYICGTGQVVTAPYGTKYVGTFMLHDGIFVGHVFG